MPCRLRVKIFEARDLPVMDRSSQLTDAFVEVRFGEFSERTEICRKSLNPVWNKAFRFDIPDDRSLQDSPLEINVYDYDKMSSNDIIGSVILDLHSLVNESTPLLTGWFPIFDTLRGLCGEIRFEVRIEYFGNVNAFTDASAGIQFFSVSTPLTCYTIEKIYGFVEDSIVKDDPEYHWADSFKSARSANVARQILLYRLSGQIRRQIGRAARDLGANAVLAFDLHFDMVGKDIIARGYGTAVKINPKTQEIDRSLADKDKKEKKKDKKDDKRKRHDREKDDDVKKRKKDKKIRKIEDDDDEKAVRETSREKNLKRSKNEGNDDDIVINEEYGSAEKPKSHRRKKSQSHLAQQQETSSDEDKEPKKKRVQRKESKRLRKQETEEYSASSSSDSSSDDGRKLAREEKRKADRKAENFERLRASAEPHDENKTRNKDKDKDNDTNDDKDDKIDGSGKASSRSRVKKLPISEEKESEGNNSLSTSTKDRYASDGLMGRSPSNAESIGVSPDRPPDAQIKAPQTFNAKDVQMLTLKTFQPEFYRIHLGGVVAARAIKLIKSTDKMQEHTIMWWNELRDEVRSHAQYLNCTHIIGYSETTSIQEDLIVLSAVGTAAVLKYNEIGARGIVSNSTNPSSSSSSSLTNNPEATLSPSKVKAFPKLRTQSEGCTICHIPYSQTSSPFPMQLLPCNICKKKLVPEVLLCSIEPPADLRVTGTGRLLEARVCRKKDKLEGEANAIHVSDLIPFLEYDLHQQLLYKLKVYGANAIFGLRIQLTVGETMIVALASGTAVYLPGLPAPPLLHINTNIKRSEKDSSDSFNLLEIQNKIMKVSEKNRQTLSNAPSVLQPDITGHVDSNFGPGQEAKDLREGTPRRDGDAKDAKSAKQQLSSSAQPEKNDGSENSELPVAATQEQNTAFVLEVDDELDEDSMVVLLDPEIPEGFSIVTTETLPGTKMRMRSNIQTIIAVKRISWDIKKSSRLNRAFSNLFKGLISSLVFKLKEMIPCCVCSLNTEIQLPDDDGVQVLLTAIAVALSNDTQQQSQQQSLQQLQSETKIEKIDSSLKSSNPAQLAPRESKIDFKAERYQEEDMLFSLELESPMNSSIAHSTASSALSVNASSLEKGTKLLQPLERDKEEGHSNVTQSSKEETHHPSIKSLVELSPLSYIPGARIERYLGRVSLHLIKERVEFKEGEGSEDGLGVFTHEFLLEAQSVLRAHILLLGGNALCGFKIDELRINENTESSNRGYCLICMSGDALYTRSLESNYGFRLLTKRSKLL